jgi:integrase
MQDSASDPIFEYENLTFKEAQAKIDELYEQFPQAGINDLTELLEGRQTEEEARAELQRRLHRAVEPHWREAVVHFAEKTWINWELGQIQLPREVTKNAEPRIIPLFPKLQDTLQKRCALSGGHHIFSHWDQYRQAHVPYTSFQGFFRQARTRAGLKDLRIHDLRHTFASWWSQNGGDLLTLKALLGHADLRMVERYSHLNTESQHRAVAEMNRRIEKL